MKSRITPPAAAAQLCKMVETFNPVPLLADEIARELRTAIFSCNGLSPAETVTGGADRAASICDLLAMQLREFAAAAKDLEEDNDTPPPLEVEEMDTPDRQRKHRVGMLLMDSDLLGIWTRRLTADLLRAHAGKAYSPTSIANILKDISETAGEAARLVEGGWLRKEVRR